MWPLCIISPRLQIRASQSVSGSYLGNPQEEPTAATWGTSLVRCRLDYINSIMYGISTSNMHKLQSVQNFLTYVVLPSL